jgi:hypothetical protein
MEVMKLSLLLLVAGLAGAAELSDVKTVYLLPMANSLDQFLAIRLTTGVVLQVVTDPQKADAILTDKIGTSFEQKLDDLYGVKQKDPDDKSDSTKFTPQAQSRAKGAVFLVDRKSRNVLWSMYERPKNNSPDELNHIADKIAGKLLHDTKGNK